MFPQFTFLGKTFSTYGICALIGILFALFLPYVILEKQKYNEIRYLFMMLIAMASSLIGSHLLYGIVNYRLLFIVFQNLDQIHTFGDFFNLMKEIFGGSVYYGGLITGILGGFIYLKKTEKNRAPYADMGAAAIPLFHGFGRIGCFLGGCCYGVECSFGFTYQHALIESANGVSRFPVQLVESGLNFMLFGLLLLLYLKKSSRGKLVFLYLIIYPVIRFILEFFRGDTYRGFVGFLSTSQLISLLLLAFSVFSLLFIHRKEKKQAGRINAETDPNISA